MLNLRRSLLLATMLAATGLAGCGKKEAPSAGASKTPSVQRVVKRQDRESIPRQCFRECTI